MRLKIWTVFAAVPLAVFTLASAENVKKGKKRQHSDVESTAGPDVLWQSPGNISSRNLFYGPGGKAHEPHGRFTFVEEDLDGTNPKFVVRDQDGVRWKAKLGLEARPETAASRLVWATGYHANEDYFLPDMHVDNMPGRLKRGQDMVSPDGSVRDVRLKRYLKGEKKIGEWSWEQNPFTGTKELNGLRVVMALINNWDLKDVNNAIYEEKSGEASKASERIYMISDLGASFGTPGISWPLGRSKGDLDTYKHSKFVVRKGPDYFDFAVPGRPTFVDIAKPGDYSKRLGLEWIGKQIPREHVRWIGQLLSQITPEQVADAFRAAGYSDDQINGFVAVVVSRIEQIDSL